MSTISLRIPDSLHKQIRELAKQEGISINQFAATALAEKLAALLTEEYLEQRGGSASRSRYEHALSKVRDDPPNAEDALEANAHSA